MKNKKRVLILGAGNAGVGLVYALLNDSEGDYLPVAFLDDDLIKQGENIHGVQVVGRFADISRAIETYAVELLLIALPSADSETMQRAVLCCERTHLPFRTLPSINDFISGRVSLTTQALRDVSVEDLLGRDQVALDWTDAQRKIAGKRILVTGGGGSIGAELCRHLAGLEPASLVIIDNSEFNLYEVVRELHASFPELSLTTHLVDITRRSAIKKIMARHQPQLLFHAAACKHVPLLELDVEAAIHNNVLGLRVVAEEAAQHNVGSFVFISTDKAVNPGSVMGMSKRVGELFCYAISHHVSTQFFTVRFGNVLNSAGSVVPLFREQIAAGGPVTVTHPEAIRYFMSIQEAAQLVIQAALIDEDAATFILDMGKPININYLAEQMINLAGRRSSPIEIVYTGLRPGEKLVEELVYLDEKLMPTQTRKILRVSSDKTIIPDKQWLIDLMDQIIAATDKVTLQKLLTTFSKGILEYV